MYSPPNMIYILSPDCKLVIGKVRAALYDLRCRAVYLISLPLARLFHENKIHLKDIPSNLSEEFSTLEQNQCVIQVTDIEIIDPLSQSESEWATINCIIEYSTSLPLRKIAQDLNRLYCEKIAIFTDNPIKIKDITLISEVLHTYLPYIDTSIYINYNQIDPANFEGAITHLQAFSNIVFYDAPSNKEEATDFTRIIHTTSRLKLTSCREHRQYRLILGSRFYNESQQYNNCLYGKIVILKDGSIKNCPLSHKIYGTVFAEQSLRDVIESEDFQSYWTLSKDKVEGCMDCELRYACLDCRYLSNGFFSTKRPNWCNYPFED